MGLFEGDFSFVNYRNILSRVLFIPLQSLVGTPIRKLQDVLHHADNEYRKPTKLPPAQEKLRFDWPLTNRVTVHTIFSLASFNLEKLCTVNSSLAGISLNGFKQFLARSTSRKPQLCERWVGYPDCRSRSDFGCRYRDGCGLIWLYIRVDANSMVRPFYPGELGGPKIPIFLFDCVHINLHISSSIGGGHGIFGAVNPSGECFSFFLQLSQG